MVFSIFLKNQTLKTCALPIDSYFYKTFYNLYRFKSRVKMYHLGMPTSPFGDEDLDKAYAKIDNPLIKQSLNVKKHPEEPHFPNEYSLKGAPYGRVYEKFPFKYKVEKDKAYSWCSCGYSINQPFCDMTHKILWTNSVIKRTPKYRPIKYIATETKEVWFCNCKQSKERPICDGTCKIPNFESKNSN